MNKLRNTIQIILCLMLTALSGHAALGEYWQRVRTAPVTSGFRDAIWTGSQFVAVGAGIYRSVDGKQWERQITVNHRTLEGIAYSGSMYVAVGRDKVILYSQDGSYWQHANYPLNGEPDLLSVVWAGDKFIAVGENGHVAKSTDGINWVVVDPMLRPSPRTLNEVIWADGKIVASGSSALVSADGGTTWTLTGLPGNQGTTVFHNGSQFIVLGSRHIHTSPDAVTWTERFISEDHDYGGYMEAIDWDGSKYTMTNGNGHVFTSTDGATWTTGHSSRLGYLSKLLYVNGKHYGFYSGATTVISSPDGINWETIHQGPVLTDKRLDDVKFLNGYWYVVGDGGVILRSKNCRDWTRHGPDFNDQYRGITWTGTKYVVVGNNVILTSTDGENWQRHDSDYLFSDILWTGQELVAVDVSGRIVTSTDGLTWILRYDDAAHGQQFNFRAIGWSGSQYVAVGTDASTSNSSGVILTSSDRLTWTRHHPGPYSHTHGSSSALHAVLWANNRWVVVGANGAILTSLNGVAWNFQSRYTSSTQYGLTWGNGLFYASTWDGVYASPDGITWERKTGTYYGRFYYAIAHHLGKFVVVGHNGAIESSTNGIQWTNRGAVEHDADFWYTFLYQGKVWCVNPFGNVIASEDGSTWQGVEIGVNRLPNAMIRMADDRLLILENDGGIIISGGDTEHLADSGVTTPLYGGCRSGQLFVVVGANGVILTSPDGETWTQRTSGVTELLWDVTWTGTNFVAVGDTATVLTSPDGITWTKVNPGFRYSEMTCVTYVDGVVYTMVDGRIPMVSYDHGATWVRWVDKIFGAKEIRGLVWTGHALIGVGEDGEIWVSRKDFNPEYLAWVEANDVSMFESALLQDSNKNGVTNLMAYALDLEHKADVPPDELARLPVVLTNEAGTNVCLAFEKPTERAAVKYIVEISSSLMPGTWTSIAEKQPGQAWAGAASVREEPGSDGYVKVKVAYPHDIHTDGLRFMRLRVEWLEAP